MGNLNNMFELFTDPLTLDILKTRRKLISLPTEIVYPDYHTGESFDIKEWIKSANYYTLPDKLYPPVLKEYNVGNCKGQWNDFQVIVEVFENWGDDGHVSFQLNGFIRCYKSELPKNWKEYCKFKDKFYKLNRKPERSQLCFKDYFGYGFSYGWEYC